MTEINNLETPEKAKKKKYPFKLISSNYIFGGIVAIIVIFLNTRSFELDGFLIGNIIGSLFGVILFPLLVALFFWYILGRKKEGGTIAFNIMMAIMLFSQFGQYSRNIQEKDKSSKNILNALSEYKKSTIEHPDSIDVNYSKLSTTLEANLSELISKSTGDEKKVYIIAQDYRSKFQTAYMDWSDSYVELSESKIFDFNYLLENKPYDSQLNIINNYISETKNYQTFFENRIPFLTKELKVLKNDGEFARGFIGGVLKKDTLQKPVFETFINTHKSYGNNLKDILELFKKEHGKWKIENETLLFDRVESEQKYNTLLLEAIKQEEQIDSLNNELIKVM